MNKGGENRKTYHLSPIHSKEEDETFTISSTPRARSETGHILNHCHFRIDLRIWNPDFGTIDFGGSLCCNLKVCRQLCSNEFCSVPDPAEAANLPVFIKHKLSAKHDFSIEHFPILHIDSNKVLPKEAWIFRGKSWPQSLMMLVWLWLWAPIPSGKNNDRSPLRNSALARVFVSIFQAYNLNNSSKH